MDDLVNRLRLVAQKRHAHNLRTLTIANADTAMKAADRIEQLERWLAEDRSMMVGIANERDAAISARDEALRMFAAEKALADDLDGGLKVAQDLIEAASKLLTKKSGTKWGLWYLDRITELRAAYRKAREQK